jgi:predicted RNase H-like HicB family nuclease
MKLKVVLEPSEEGGFTAYVPAFLVVLAKEIQKGKP